MTELARNIHALKELLRVAWSELANPQLTPFERREARNQVNQYGAELRRHLQLTEAERSRSGTQSLVENTRDGFGKAKFQILA